MNHTIACTMLALLAPLALPACLDTAEEAPAAPIATLAASGALDIVSWDISPAGPEGDSVRIVGRDQSAMRRVEMVVARDAQTPDARVHVEAVFPDHLTFDLTSSGELDGAASEYAKVLGAALYTDVGHKTTPIASPSELGTVSSAASIARDQGALNLGWSMFGYANTAFVGPFCGGGRTRSDDSGTALQYGTASFCTFSWMSGTTTDCRGKIDYAIAGWRYDTCFWNIYVNL